MSFEWPLGLVALAAIPLAILVQRALARRRARYAVRFTNLEVLASVVDRRTRWRSPLPPALFLLSLVAVAVALARPHVTRAVPDERATIVLVVDSSGSMLAKDVRPTRLAAAQNAVRSFLEKVPERVRVALVSFSSVPQVVAPATHDHALVQSSLDFLYPGGGTAIGDAIERAIEVARVGVGITGDLKVEKIPAAIVLLSDGAQRSGNLTPQRGAELARDAGIPVFTVALGTPDGVIIFDRGGFQRAVPVPPDPETLKQVASISRGTAYATANPEELANIYRDLGSRLGRKKEPQEVTFAVVAGAAALLLAAASLSVLWAPKLP
jgi:Ca-activated chloride channel family protein